MLDSGKFDNLLEVSIVIAVRERELLENMDDFALHLCSLDIG